MPEYKGFRGLKNSKNKRFRHTLVMKSYLYKGNVGAGMEEKEQRHGNPGYLENILEGEKFEDFAKKHYIEPSGSKLMELGKQNGVLRCVADLHANYTDWRTIVRDLLIKPLREGENAFLCFMGDINDPLFEYDKEGNDVERPFGNKEGKEMFEKKLAIEDDYSKRYVFLAYPDDSATILREFFWLRHFLGDRIILLDGDHEKQLRTPGFEVFKSNVDLTELTLKKLNDKEKQYVRTHLEKLPAVLKTANGYVLMHAGPVPMAESLDDIRNLRRDNETPLRKPGENDDDYERRKINWIENTIEGRLIFGKSEKRDSRAGEGDYRIYSDEEIKKTLDSLEAGVIISGHSGTAPLIHDTGDEEIPHVIGVNKMLDLDGQIIIATTEGFGCNKPRSGENRRGPNNYGIYLAIDLNEAFGSVYVGDLGDIPSPYYLKKSKKTQVAVKEKTVMPFDRCSSAMKALCDRKGFPLKLYETFVEKEEEIKKTMTEGELLVLAEQIEEDPSENIPQEGERALPRSVYLSNFPEKLKKILNG